MRKSYDFSKARPNPYAKRLKKQVTIRLDEETVEYFKSLAEGMSIPYQTLINLYLRECAASRKELRLEWARREQKGAA
jgi:uncharacterized protein (DUF4415 family)